MIQTLETRPPMPRNICLILGHPDPKGGHLCHALADAYAQAAEAAGHSVSRVDVAALDFDVMRDPADFAAPPPPDVLAAQAAVTASEHLVFVYPLWLGSMPALLKAFLEQFCRAGFAIDAGEAGRWPRKMLAGRSARVVITMGMPAFAYRLFLGAHSLKALESGILGMAGIKPVRATLFGMAGEGGEAAFRKRLDRMAALGARGG